MAFGLGNQGFGVTFTLQDAFTQTAGKIKNSFNGLSDGVGKLSIKINEALPALGGMGSVLLSGGILYGMAGVITKAGEMSDMLAGVTKATGLAGDALIQYRNDLDSLQTRTSIADLIDISVIGGKMGIAQDQLLGFTKAIDMAVVSLGDEFSGGAEEVAKRLSIMNNLFAETKSMKIEDSLTRIGSSLNFLSDAGVGSASNIAEFTNRIGQLGTMAPTITQTMGLGSALEELGINAQIASGGVTAILLQATKELPAFSKQMKISTDEAKRLIDTDVNGFFLKLGESFKGMSNVDTQIALQNMKVGSQESVKVMLQLANNIDLVRQRQSQANEAFKEGTSLMKEFENQNATFGASIAIALKKWYSIMVRIGESLKPILQPILVAITNIMEVFADFVSTPIGKAITVITVAFLALVSVMVLIGTIIPPLTAAMTLLGISTTFALGPIAWIVVRIIAIGVAIYKVTTMITKGSENMVILGNVLLALVGGPIAWAIMAFANLSRALTEFDELRDGGEVKTGVIGFLQKVGGAITGTMEVWRSATDEGFSLTEKTKNALEKIGMLDYVLAIGTYVVRIKTFFTSMWSEINSGFIKPISEAFSSFGASLSDVFKPISDVFDKIDFRLEKATGSLNLFKNAGSAMGKFIFGGKSEEGELKSTSQNNVESIKNKSSFEALEKQRANMRANNTTVNVAPSEQKAPIIQTKLVIDGRVLAETMNEHNDFHSSIR